MEKIPPRTSLSPARRQPPGLEELQSLLLECGIRFSAGQVRQLWAYHLLLRENNPQLNLTRIHNFTNMVHKLYVDSILPAQLLKLPSPLLDLGTGAGMPGIPLKIAAPELEMVLAETRRNRVAFLEMTCKGLQLSGVRIIAHAIHEDFAEPVQGVITRAVESISATLARIRGCLAQGGLAIFMKGPHCDEEMKEAATRLQGQYQLLQDHPYCIPRTRHERRLVVFQRLDEPVSGRKLRAMKRHPMRILDSDKNETFKDLKKLLSSRGIKKLRQALLSGVKPIQETLRDFPGICRAWITPGDQWPPPVDAPEGLAWYQLAPPLFEMLDILGTHAPLLVIHAEIPGRWEPSDGFAPGCSLLVPFQDPENVGAVIRSAVAFGVTRVILLAESANPYHPRALRASGGAVLRADLSHGPSLQELVGQAGIVALSAEGRNIEEFLFPGAFGLLPGLEGTGLPAPLRKQAVSIPIQPEVESLNAAAAVAVALYVWSRRDRAGRHCLSS
jgi:16S rRNA (guanine(527)-N(7))-methyltransferase RsmG